MVRKCRDDSDYRHCMDDTRVPEFADMAAERVAAREEKYVRASTSDVQAVVRAE